MVRIGKTLTLIFLCLALSGCGAMNWFRGSSTGKVTTSLAKLDKVEGAIADTKDARLKFIGQFSYGIKYNSTGSNNFWITDELNKRIFSLSTSPTLSDMAQIELLVNSLNQSNRVALIQKDREINYLQKEMAALADDKKELEGKFHVQAQTIAAQSDSNQKQIDDLKGNFGINAIWFGVKTLVVRLAWILGALTVLYTVLRFAALSNPIAASLFSIFNIFGSWIINLVKTLAPDSIKVSGNVPVSVFNSYNETLTRIIDVMQTTKTSRQKTELSQALDAPHKEIVDGIKKELLYK